MMQISTKFLMVVAASFALLANPAFLWWMFHDVDIFQIPQTVTNIVKEVTLFLALPFYLYTALLFLVLCHQVESEAVQKLDSTCIPFALVACVAIFGAKWVIFLVILAVTMVYCWFVTWIKNRERAFAMFSVNSTNNYGSA